MNKRIRRSLIYIFQPRMIILLVALFNFVWFFSGSSFVHHFGSTKISFCYTCPWYWEAFNLSYFSLFAALLIVIAKKWSYLLACFVTTYQIIEGINWLSAGSGFLGGLSQRLEIISESDSTDFWELLDVQYALALIIFITALSYLVISIFKIKQKPVVSFP
ncbi:MAG: hypothetical protein M3384_17425 [Acidobacteriota bacterium]|nr:hypothetical protein [Acidobacteriota bacterium]